MVLSRVSPNGTRCLGKCCITDRDGDLYGRRVVKQLTVFTYMQYFPLAGLFHMKSAEFRLSGFKGFLCDLLSEKGDDGAPITHS